MKPGLEPAPGPTPIGPEHANVRVHPPLLLLILLGAALPLHRLAPLVAPDGWPRWLGVCVVLVGMLPALLAVRRLARAGTTLNPRGVVRALVTDGPYRRSRNPIYLGYVFTGVGLPLALGSLWGLLLAPALALALQSLVVEPEEAYLQQRFPDDYPIYRSSARRWL